MQASHGLEFLAPQLWIPEQTGKEEISNGLSNKYEGLFQ
jgi:hypothetical protein